MSEADFHQAAAVDLAKACTKAADAVARVTQRLEDLDLLLDVYTRALFLPQLPELLEEMRALRLVTDAAAVCAALAQALDERERVRSLH